MPFSVFISYSHRDRELRQELDKHLSNLKRQNVITAWFDGDIIPGTEWESQIIKHLTTDQLILLLISADFMASDFCYSIEMTQAIARHNANQARVLPIILRPTDWKGAPFDKLKVLPTDGKAVTRWPTHDDAFEDIIQGIREAIDDDVSTTSVISMRSRTCWTGRASGRKEGGLTLGPLPPRKRYAVTCPVASALGYQTHITVAHHDLQPITRKETSGMGRLPLDSYFGPFVTPLLGSDRSTPV